MHCGIKLVTFDVMNTLIKVRGPVGSVYANAINKFIPTNHKLTKEDELKINEEFLKVYKHYYVAYPNFGYGNISSEQFWSEIVKATFMNSGCYKLDEFTMDKLTKHLYIDFCSPQNWFIFQEVTKVMVKIEKLGIKTGIISNFDERLDIILSNLDLKKYFDFIICSREYGYAKPDIKVFVKACDIANVDPSNSLHIGDNIDLDFNGAKRADMNALLINRDSTENSEHEIRGLGEIFSES